MPTAACCAPGGFGQMRGLTMSFRTNLQYLRAERHMTQEQLAMLLGVSRQSVTKWEAEKAYPEMDKLIKMCQIFECSLDDLVQGDVTQRGYRENVRDESNGVQPSEVILAREAAMSTPATLKASRAGVSPRSASFIPAVPEGPVTDVCGYDEHMVSLARKIAPGITCMVLGLAAAIFTDEVMHAEGIVLIVLFAFVAAGLALIIPAGMEHGAFKKAHPYIEDFYTAEQKQTARRRAAIAIVVGVALILAGVVASALFEVESNVRVYGGPLMMALIALGVGAIVYWGMLWGRTNLEEYNKEWFEVADLSEEELSRLDVKSREAYLRASDPVRRQKAARSAQACTVIMLVATIVALVWLFMGGPLGMPEGMLGFFWLPWVIGGIMCGIAEAVLGDAGDDRQ